MGAYRRVDAGEVVLLAVAARPLLDVLPGDLPWAGLTVARALSVALLAGLLALIATRWRAAWAHPLRWPLLAFVAMLAVGMARSPEPGAGLAAGLRYLSGVAVVVAGFATWEGRHVRRLPAALLLGLALPVAWSWASMADPDAWVRLHGTWRLVGPYRVLHAHALAMGVAVGLGLSTAALATGGTRALGLAVGLAAAVPLVASATRAGIVLAAVWGIVALWAAGRRRGVVVAAGLAVAVIVAVPVLRERFSELVLAAVGVPPERGWAWLGTGRVAIWTRSFAAWVALPVDQVLLGTGLAGYGAFWKEKEPHSELLATLYQLGPLGLGALCWAWAAGWREAWRARGAEGARAHAAIALGGWAALLVASAVGSTLLIRLTLSWTAWGLLAGALALTRPDRRPPPGRVGSAGATPVASAEGGTPTRRDGSPAPG